MDVGQSQLTEPRISGVLVFVCSCRFYSFRFIVVVVLSKLSFGKYPGLARTSSIRERERIASAAKYNSYVIITPRLRDGSVIAHNRMGSQSYQPEEVV
ncbi:unnamed protein product [Musa hybrid cultivar]